VEEDPESTVKERGALWGQKVGVPPTASAAGTRCALPQRLYRSRSTAAARSGCYAFFCTHTPYVSVCCAPACLLNNVLLFWYQSNPDESVVCPVRTLQPGRYCVSVML
jgi:hypothetical protein